MKHLLLSCAIFTTTLSTVPVYAIIFKAEKDGLSFSCDGAEPTQLQQPHVKRLFINAQKYNGDAGIRGVFLSKDNMKINSCENNHLLKCSTVSFDLKYCNKPETASSNLNNYIIENKLHENLSFPYELLERSDFKESNKRKDGWTEYYRTVTYKCLNGDIHQEEEKEYRKTKIIKFTNKEDYTVCVDLESSRTILERMQGKKQKTHTIREANLVGLIKITSTKKSLRDSVPSIEAECESVSWTCTGSAKEMLSDACVASFGATHGKGCKKYNEDELKKRLMEKYHLGEGIKQMRAPQA